MTKPLKRPDARPALVDPPDASNPSEYREWLKEYHEDLQYCLDYLDLGIGVSNRSLGS